MDVIGGKDDETKKQMDYPGRGHLDARCCCPQGVRPRPEDSIYIRKVEKKGGKFQNTVVASYPTAGQFWKWGPESFMAMTSYGDMKGKWVK